MALLPSASAQTWTQQTPATSPPGRDSANMVYDSLHHQFVLFGGQDGSNPLNDTWVYDGTTWTQLHPATSPSARVWPAMAFDSLHGKVVLYGGATGTSGTPLSDTWTWDGTNWTQLSPATSPSARKAAAMAFDAATGTTILFGGAPSSGVLQDTWSFNGTTWTQLTTSTVPARRFAAMSYDQQHSQLVMFGGDNGSSNYSDTWLWNGTDWSQQTPAHSPSARGSQGQAYDSVRNLTVLFGGSGLNDTWTWNGTDWTQESTPASPVGRYYVNMAYDIQHSNMVIFGGQNASLSGVMNDTWKLGYFGTQNWVYMPAAVQGGPGALYNVASAILGGNNWAYVFGGNTGTQLQGDSWGWTGNQWSHYAAPSGMTPRQQAAAAYDATNSNIVMFGGNSSLSAPTPLADTWTYSPFGLQRSPANSPASRYSHAMVYDAAHGKTMLFGGHGASSYLNDTWFWSGTDWGQVVPATSPSVRSGHSLVYDGAHSQVMMFGGYNGSAYLNETWIWNGTTWVQQTPATSPPARANFAMVYDSIHGMVVIFGGTNASGALNDTWTWDGTTWTQMAIATPVTARSGMAGVFQPTTGEFFMFGGANNSSTALGETWILSSPYVSSAMMTTGFWGQSYSYTIVPAGGVAPYTFSATGSPWNPSTFGLTLNTTTGAITGTDTITAGQPPVGFGIIIRDAQGASSNIVFELRTDSALSLSPGSLPDATVGTNYSVALSASGGTSPFTYSATGLPSGLAVSGANIVGQCTAAGSSSSVVLQVVDSLGGIATVGPISLNCNPAPQITDSSPLATAFTGVYYSHAFSTNAVYDPPGASPYVWQLVGTVPGGMNFNAGTLYGIPNTPGVYPFSIQFTDAWGATTTKPFQLTVVHSLLITNHQLPLGTLTMAYPSNAAIVATGGQGSYQYSAIGMPPGLNIDSTTGAITGLPTALGIYNPTFTVTDQLSNSYQVDIAMTVEPPGTNPVDWFWLSPATAPGRRNGAAMFYDSSANETILFGGFNNNDPPGAGDVWAWDGSNWSQLFLDSSPTARGQAAAAFDVTNAAGVLFGGNDGNSTTLGDTWTWSAAFGGDWSLQSPTHHPPARQAASMAWDGHQIVLFGGRANSTLFGDTWIWNGTDWTQVAGSGPPARQLAAMAYDSVRGKVVLYGGGGASNQDLSDTWLWDGSSKTWTQVTPANNPGTREQASAAFDSRHGQVILFGGWIAGADGALFDTWAWDGTNWTPLSPPDGPAGLLSSSMVYDSTNAHLVLFGGYSVGPGDVNDTWVFDGPVVTNLTLPDGLQNASYSQAINLVDGIAPYLFASSSLPAGMSLGATTGVFGGTPTTAGNYPIPVNIQDGYGASIVPQFSLHVASPASPLTLSPTTLPNATAGANYLQQLSATGGVGSYTFGATGLPTGLSLNGSNQLVGQCTASSSSVMLTVHDSNTPVQNTASVGPLTITCNAAPSITTSSPLGNGIVNTAYSATIQMTGGTPTITWSLTTGTLPTGFALSQAGVLTGMATAATTSNFSVTVTDIWGGTTTKAFQVSFYTVPSITTTSLPTGVNGSAYQSGVTLGVSGGTGSGTYTYSATGMPNGMGINSSTGVISGTPTQSGVFQPTFTVVDQTPQTVQKQLVLMILASTGNPNWTNLAPTAVPAARDSYAMAYDAVRAQTVLYGGTGLNDTWVYGLASGWSQKSPTNSPTAQQGASVAWLSSKSNIVLFGGRDHNGVPLNQTWVWDGANWTQKNPATNPPARYFAAMAEDTAHGQVVLFGGSSGSGSAGALSDTWVWDGTNWTQKSPSTVPPAKFAPSMSNGPTGPVLFGGVSAANVPSSQTWVWDGSNWNQKSTVVSPSARSMAAMAYDSQNNVARIFGGFDGSSFPQDTWQWDGTSWTQVNPATIPSGRDTFDLAYDSGFGVTLMFGGAKSPAPDLSDTWMLGGPVAPNTTLPGGVAGANYTANLGVIGGTTAYTITQTGNPQNLPAGLSLNGTTGQITGATQSVGTFSVGINTVDSQGLSKTQTFSLTISPTSALSLLPASLPAGTIGASYTATLTPSGGVGPYSLTATGLTGTGLSLSGAIISGTCNVQPGSISITVTDSALPTHNSTVFPYTLSCNAAPAITTASPLANGVVNTAYSATIQMTGGTPTITWSLTPGTLPAGFALSQAGVLTGAATAAGTSNFSVTVTDIWGATATKAFQVSFYSAVSITTTTLPTGVNGSAYQSGVTLGVSGGTGTYTYSATGMPNGMGINSTTGVISGTPTQSGVFQPTFTVVDQTPQTVHQQLVLMILASTGNPNWTNLAPTTAPGARDSYAMAYDAARAQAVLYGGTGLNDTWVYGLGSPWSQKSPANSPVAQQGASMVWFSSKSNIVLFGGRDQNGVPQNQTWVWDGANWTQKNPANNPPARYFAGMAEDTAHGQVVLFGGSIGSGSAGAVSDTWVWDGTNWAQKFPTAVPPAVFAPSMSNGPTGPVLFGGVSATNVPTSQTWVWDGANWNQKSPVVSPPARGEAGMVYDSQNSVARLFGGLNGSNYLQDTWQWDGASWTQLNPSAVPPGRDAMALAYDSGFGVTLLFGGAKSSLPDLSDTWMLGGPLAPQTTLSGGTAGASYTGSLGVIGGTPAYTITPTGNPQSLPTGLTLNTTTGQITGATQLVGTYLVGMTTVDSQGLSKTQTFSLTISPTSALSLLPASLPAGTLGAAYTTTLTPSGGVGPYSLTATGLTGTGLSLSGATISGTCNVQPGSVSITVTDSALPVANTATFGYTINCNAAPAITTSSPLSSGVVNSLYSATIQMTGGTPNFTWSLTPGTLPGGFALSQAGVLTGTATAAGTSNFSVTVTDTWGAATTKAFQVTFYSVLSITTTSLPGGTAGTAYSGGSITAAGGTGAGTYTYGASGLPPGFSISPTTGVISGTTTQTGSYTPTFTLTDHDSQTASKQIGLTISPSGGITISSPALLPGGTSGQAYSYQLAWTGGISPYFVSGTGLPAWLQVNQATGRLTGTPPVGGAFSFPITVTDSQTPTANSASMTFTLVVNAPTITTASPLPTATIAIPYSQNLAASGGSAVYTWSASNLPGWLTLTSGGKLSGTPPSSAPASIPLAITVTDSLGAFTTGTLTLPIQATPTLMFVSTSPLPPATANVLYSQTVNVSGGTGVYTFGSSGMPAWLSLNTTSGALTGTPPAAGPVTFQITVSDTSSQSLSQMFTLPVNASLTFTTTSPLPAATVGAAYSGSMAASGGSGSYTWSATGQPSWLTLSSAGAFSGTPTAAGNVTFSVTLTDTLNNTLTQSFTLPVDASLTIKTTSPLPAATANFPYTATFTAAGGSGTYAWSATGLTGNFSLSTAGTLTGTPTASGPITFSVTLTDTLNNTLTQSFTLPVNATVTITNTSPLPPAVVTKAYTANFAASGGAPGYTWSATGLPSWLTLTSAGYLSGTVPATAGSVTFQVTVTDSASHSITAPFTLPVNGTLSITTTLLPSAATNSYYSASLAASGGLNPYNWSATGLPAGLSITSAGVLIGTSQATGVFTVQLTVTDGQNSTASKSLTLVVTTGLPLSIVTQSIGGCTVGVSCSYQIVASGGLPPYVFSLPPNFNVPGVGISSTGQLSITPTTDGGFGVTVVVTDQLLNTVSKSFSSLVTGILAITPTALPSGTVGVSYSAGVASSGGQTPFTWSITSGGLPPGLLFDGLHGMIIGTPNTAGTYTFSLQVRDSQQTSQPQSFTITIAPPPLPLTITSGAQLPPGLTATPYSQTLQAVGGTAPYGWSITSGSLPAGLTLASSGLISGKPTTAQTATFTAKVVDSAGATVSGTFSLLVTNSTQVTLLTSNPLPDGIVGIAYLYGVSVQGGTPPYMWSIVQGAVPPGLVFDATTGGFTGTPTQPGVFTFVMKISDSSIPTAGASSSALQADVLRPRVTATTNYTLRVVAASDFQITASSVLPKGTVRLSYSVALGASGGKAPYKWQLVNGNLPPGLTMDSAGKITGTPVVAGQSAFSAQATDSSGAVATGAFQLLVVDPNLPVITSTLGVGTVGTAYQGGFGASGGKAPYSWSIQSGSLPPGLGFDTAGGAISGTPTQSGDFDFTVRLTDSAKVSASAAASIRVNVSDLQITPSSVPNATLNAPYFFGLSANGGTLPYTWSLSAGGLLSGFSIDSGTGMLAGVPTVSGTYPFTITVADAKFGVASQQYQLTVQTTGITITSTNPPTGTVGLPYSFGLQVSNAAPPISWSQVSGGTPPGISFNAATGGISGTPTSAGSFTFKVQVKDVTTATASASLTIAVNPPPLVVTAQSLAAGSVGTAYSQTVQSSGGTGSVTWSLVSGTLPAGITLAPNGALSGTPTSAGSYSFTLQVTDSTGVFAKQSFTINIAGPPSLPAVTLSGLAATSSPGDQPTVTMTLSSAYSLPLQVTATLSLTPNPAGPSDLMFANKTTTTQFTIPANATQSTVSFQVGTLPGVIQISFTVSAVGVDITPTPAPSMTTKIVAAPPVIKSVTVAAVTGGMQITIIGTSTTLDMTTANFHFTPAAGSTLQSSDVAVDVSGLFRQWYGSSASLATGSQFTLTLPFTVGNGSLSSIASVSVTLTNTAGTSAAVTANMP